MGKLIWSLLLLLQGCLKEKTLENLEKYVAKDVSVTLSLALVGSPCAQEHTSLPTLPSFHGGLLGQHPPLSEAFEVVAPFQGLGQPTAGYTLPAAAKETGKVRFFLRTRVG